MATTEELPLFQSSESQEERQETSSETSQMSLFHLEPLTSTEPVRESSRSSLQRKSSSTTQQQHLLPCMDVQENAREYQRTPLEASLAWSDDLLSSTWLRHWQGCLWWPTTQPWESLLVTTRLVLRLLQQERCAPEQMLVLVRDQGQATALRQQLSARLPQWPQPAILTLRQFALLHLLPAQSLSSVLGCPEQLRLLRSVLPSGSRAPSNDELDALWRMLRFQKNNRESRDEAWTSSLPAPLLRYERALQEKQQVDLDDLLFLAEERLRFHAGLQEQCHFRFHTMALWLEGAALTPVEVRLLTLLSRSQQDCFVVGQTQYLKTLRNEGFGSHIRERWGLPFSTEQFYDSFDAVTPQAVVSLEESQAEVQWFHTSNDLAELHKITRWLQKHTSPRELTASSPPSSSPWWPSQVSIVFQTPAQLPLIEGVLRDRKIPYDTALPSSHLKQKGVWQTLALLRFLASSSGDQNSLVFLLEHDALIREATIQQLLNYQKAQELSPRRLIGQFERIPNIPPNQRILLGYLAELLIHLRRDLSRRTPEQLLRMVWEQLLNCHFFLDPQLPPLEVQERMLEQARGCPDVGSWLRSVILDNTLFQPSALHALGKVALVSWSEAQHRASSVVFVLGCEKDLPSKQWKALAPRQRLEHPLVETMKPLASDVLYLCLTRYRMQPTTSWLACDYDVSVPVLAWEEESENPTGEQLKLF